MKNSQEDFLKKQIGITPKNYYEDLRNHELKGKGTFEDKQGKRFILEWVARYRIVNKERAYERHVLDRSLDLIKIINEDMQKIFPKYNLKVVNTGMAENLNGFIPLHKILDPEIQEGLLNPSLLTNEGIKIDALVQEKFDLVREKGEILVSGEKKLPLFIKHSPLLKEETFIQKKEEKREYELLYSGQKRKFISSEKAEEVRRRKGQRMKDEIFIDDERKEAFFKKTLINEFQGQMYSTFCHFVENGGIGGGKMEIYRGVWEDFTGAAIEENISGAVDVAMKRFRDILQKYKIGKIVIKSAGVYSSKKTYILEPKRTYCVLKKIENEEI